MKTSKINHLFSEQLCSTSSLHKHHCDKGLSIIYERSLGQVMFMALAIQVIIHVVITVITSAIGSCPTGEFQFALGRNMVENYALRGHVFANVTATEPIRCFRACQLDCRCISFNYQQTRSKDNCQLNEENRYTNFSALEFLERWQYYDLVIDYNIKVKKTTYIPVFGGNCLWKISHGTYKIFLMRKLVRDR